MGFDQRHYVSNLGPTKVEFPSDPLGELSPLTLSLRLVAGPVPHFGLDVATHLSTLVAQPRRWEFDSGLKHLLDPQDLQRSTLRGRQVLR
jgi:hypothetical protein